ncbi:hypothetical protein [Williamsia soli]|nr:hypothetical protein [Williamsia soli]
MKCVHRSPPAAFVTNSVRGEAFVEGPLAAAQYLGSQAQES